MHYGLSKDEGYGASGAQGCRAACCRWWLCCRRRRHTRFCRGGCRHCRCKCCRCERGGDRGFCGCCCCCCCCCRCCCCCFYCRCCRCRCRDRRLWGGVAEDRKLLDIDTAVQPGSIPTRAPEVVLPRPC